MKNIVLTGMPGCGKSTIAKCLYKKFSSFKLIELDDEIERQENCSVSDIFKNKGEKYFRKKETELIKEISNFENLIISLGGGSFDSEENRNLLKKNSISFFLDCNTTIIFERIKKETQRPLLNTKNPIEKLKELYNKRIENYKKADIIIDAKNTTENITNEIIRIYNERTN